MLYGQSLRPQRLSEYIDIVEVQENISLTSHGKQAVSSLSRKTK